MQYSKEKLEELVARWKTKKGIQTLKTIKKTNCFLNPIEFHEKIKNFPGITDEEIVNTVDLRGAPLAGFDFRIPIEEEHDGYFENIAILSNISFEGANLKHCVFEDGSIHECYFENTNLSHADFNNADISNCSFENAIIIGTSFRGTKLASCNFTDAELKDLSLDSTIIDEKSHFGKELKSEKEKNFHMAAIELKQIKEMYKNSSLHELADKYHYKEMIAKRKKRNISHPLRWINYIFGDLLCKYGTSYWRVFFWSVTIMIICALLYQKHDGLLYQAQEVELTFLDSLYFSSVTFTTLGYGDLHAVGLMRQLAAAEGFIGAALMSLFTVIMARNIIRD
ncbi:MAG: pentapeptide repeat-containing protein [Candidatus Gracilibacteria bacterium]|jgi:uncharacterized protein YjbI with pentapeptide repeats